MGKIIIYQVFTRLFGNDTKSLVHNGGKDVNGCGKFSDFTLKALEEIKALGATHIWYTGVIEHATTTDYTEFGIAKDHSAVVKGKAGSPYAIKDYYDVDPDLATKVPDRRKEYSNLIGRTHKAGLKVIMDFVPNHVARQYHSDCAPVGVKDLGQGDITEYGFHPDNNFYYNPGQQLSGNNLDLLHGEKEPYVEYPAKATGNDHFDAYPGINDWYETIKINYGKDYLGGRGNYSPTPSTWEKMLNILLYWAGYGIDGFRCDMAEMVPVEFWEWAIPKVKEKYPEIIFIAEVYNPAEYRNYIYKGHFDFLYDKVGLYDTLRAVAMGNQPASAITSSWQQTDDISSHMLNFLENHDEQRIASEFFLSDGVKARPALVVSSCLNTSPFMLYFGQELGERGMDIEGFSGRDGRTTIFDYWSVDTIRRWRAKGKFDSSQLTESEKELQSYYKKVLSICNNEKAISEGKKFDLMYVNYGGFLLNDHRQYAFMRKYGNELILIVANFMGQDARVGVKIPEHTFTYLEIPEMENAEGTDLIHGTKGTYQLVPDKICFADVKANDAVIIKFVL